VTFSLCSVPARLVAAATFAALAVPANLAAQDSVFFGQPQFFPGNLVVSRSVVHEQFVTLRSAGFGEVLRGVSLTPGTFEFGTPSF
jgi:hypothetical protein